MRKLLFDKRIFRSGIMFIILLMPCTSIMAQSITDSVHAAIPEKDTAWKFGGNIAITFSQSYFDNWSAGGEKSLAMNSRANIFYNYARNKTTWENSLDLAYGFTYIGYEDFKKNDDLFELNSKFGYKASKKWYYSALFNIRSQFDIGKEYKDSDTTIISDFLAPMYINLALGMDYKPVEVLSAFISPVNLKYVYVRDTVLSERYAIDRGKNSKIELGSILKVNYKQDITEYLSLSSRFELFYSYTDTPDIPYISWEVLGTLKVFNILSINLNTHLIYDENFNPEDPKIQFKEVFGFGIAYKW